MWAFDSQQYKGSCNYKWLLMILVKEITYRQRRQTPIACQWSHMATYDCIWLHMTAGDGWNGGRQPLPEGFRVLQGLAGTRVLCGPSDSSPGRAVELGPPSPHLFSGPYRVPGGSPGRLRTLNLQLRLHLSLSYVGQSHGYLLRI